MKASSLPYPFRSRAKAPAEGRGNSVSLGCPVILHRLALIAIVALVLVSALVRIPSFLVVVVFLLVLGAVSWYWSYQSLRNLTIRTAVAQERAFPGETVDLTFELSSRNGLPLAWLEVEEEVPWRLVTGVLAPPSPYSRERLRWTTALAGRQGVKWTHHLTCQARGDYRLGPVRLRSGDPFGVYPREIVVPCFLSLLVYPKIVPINRFDWPLRELVGEKSAPPSVYEDATRTIGSRDYRPGDPFKRIHWKASARGLQLQARQYESTTSLNLLLALDLEGFAGGPKDGAEDFELAVSIAASLAAEALRQGFAFGLAANGAPEIRVPAASGRTNLLLVLDRLARITPVTGPTIQELLLKREDGLPPGTTVVVIGRIGTPSLSAVVRELAHRGHAARLLTLGEIKKQGAVEARLNEPQGGNSHQLGNPP